MLTVTFFGIAFLYSIIGFGGGSSYLSVLTLYEIPYIDIPKIGLISNLIVVIGGCYFFLKNKVINTKLSIPLILTSAPFAYFGGRIALEEKNFYIILFISILFSSIRILMTPTISVEKVETPSILILILTGAILGFLAGLVSIGGGIFLTPLLLNLNWGTPKEVAGTSCLFIFINSVFGILGQFSREINFNFSNYLPLFFAVFLGGQIGSRLIHRKFMTLKKLQKITGVLMLIISFTILRKIF